MNTTIEAHLRWTQARVSRTVQAAVVAALVALGGCGRATPPAQHAESTDTVQLTPIARDGTPVGEPRTVRMVPVRLGDQ